MTSVMYIVHESSSSWLVVTSHTVLMVHCKAMNCPRVGFGLCHSTLKLYASKNTAA